MTTGDTPGTKAQSDGGLSESAHVWPYVIAILLLPILVLWRQDNSLFTPSGHIDSWFYFGFFKNLPDFKADLVPNTYYGSRLSWILPGFIIHSLWKPVLATAILHLGVFYTAAFSLFVTLTLTAGVRPAFLTTLAFCCNPQVWYAVGTDYVDGGGLAFCLLALALLTATALVRDQWWLPVLAGGVVLCWVCDNIFWVSLVPLLGLHYAGLLRLRGRLSIWVLLRDLLLRCGAGFLLALAGFAAINHRLDGSYDFWAPNFRAIAVFSKNNPWFRYPWTSYGLDPWLWLTAVVAALALIVVLFRSHSSKPVHQIAILFCIEFLAGLAVFAYMQFRMGMAPLALPIYASALLPFLFLAIGVCFWKAAEGLTDREWLLLCVAGALLFGLIWGDYRYRFTPVWPHAIVPVAVSGSMLLAAGLLLARRRLGMIAALAGLACFAAEGRFAHAIITAELESFPPPPHANRLELERIAGKRDKVESLRRKGPVRFWYDEHEPAHEDFVALNSSYVYTYTRIQTPFPELSCEEKIAPGTLIVVTSQQEGAAELAVHKLEDCRARTGLLPALVDRGVTASPGGTYTTVFLRLLRDPAKWRVLEPTFSTSGPAALRLEPYFDAGADLPVSHWEPLSRNPAVKIRAANGGEELEAPPQKHTDTAHYGPMTIPQDGRYEFVLHLTPGVGQFAFGLVSGDSWLAVDVSGHSSSARLMDCEADLKKGQVVDLRISNTSQTDRPLSMVINGLSAFERDSDPRAKQ